MNKPIEEEEQKPRTVLGTLHYIVYTIMFVLAIFVSIKCNDGFEPKSFIAAFCCSPFYLIYKLAMRSCSQMSGELGPVGNYFAPKA
jgi:hypothetical protein